MPHTVVAWKPITLALLACVLILSACSSQAPLSDIDNPGRTSSSMPATGTQGNATKGETPTGEQGDIVFAEMMIPHHMQAVEMADLALARDGASPVVRDLAARIKAAQQPEIDLMSSWLEQWGVAAGAGAKDQDSDHSGHDMGDMDMGNTEMLGMMSDEQMNALQSAKGGDFDQLWLTLMIEHHQGAIQMAVEVMKSTSNVDVMALAKAIADAQETEIGQMEAALDG
jgi:uncharacterized protein (DUF305 family)